MKIKLRPYQLESITELRQGFAKKYDRQILALTTGAGKTVIFSEMVRLAYERETITLVLTDRIELFKQTFGALARHGMKIQELNAKQHKDTFSPAEIVTVAMVETMSRRDLTDYKPQLIIIDEAHKGNFTKVLEKYPLAKVIGVTATPVGKHIPKYYENIIQPIDTPELIELGFLSPCKAYQMVDDFSDLKESHGDYTDKSLFDHFDKKKLYSGVVDQWQKLTPGQKTLVFNVNIKHTEEMNRQFNEAGVRSECVTSKTPKDERDRILAAFSEGLFPVLNNCGILTTGYDEPSITCVIMNRKTKSLPLWLQCCGRGSRIFPNKTHFTVLDFGMNHDVHGLWEEPRNWTLKQKRKSKKQAAPVKECPTCEAMLFASARVCRYCGHEFPVSEGELSEGVMIEVAPTAPSELVGAKIGDLSIDELIKLQKSKKYKPSFIWRVIRSHGKESLKDYGQKMEYSSGWVYRQEQQINDNQFTNFTVK